MLNATQALIAEGVYGPEFEKQLRYRAAHQVNVKNVLDVLPNPENRITLSAQKDAMGIPKPQAHYAIDEYTRRGAEVSKADFTRIAELMGGTNLRYSAEGNFANNQHITGTMSMGNDPKTSVVDRFGRTHDHEKSVHRQYRCHADCGHLQLDPDWIGAGAQNCAAHTRAIQRAYAGSGYVEILIVKVAFNEIDDTPAR
ncbi:GMC oxidoreductase [Undibacterium arcticum]